MKHVSPYGKLLAILLLLLSFGCDANNGAFPAGGIVERETEPAAEIPRDVDADPVAASDQDKPRRQKALRFGDGFSDRREPLPSRKQNWGNDRRTPSDSMSSKTESWGKDRRMPSDSMPSKTVKWGADRKMPSDSMPSKTEKWGKARRMPSDSMPSKSFGRQSDSVR